MNGLNELLKPVAPNLAAAMNGPFKGVATKYILDQLADEAALASKNPSLALTELLQDAKNLSRIQEVDHSFRREMEQLNVDLFALETEAAPRGSSAIASGNRPQLIISACFLSAYFLMLAFIFVVEVSDTVNMRRGENSLMGELQILFGVLTAGVGQILSFWFGGVLGRNRLAQSGSGAA